MSGRRPLAETITFHIKCPNCGEHAEKPVGWLKDHDFLPCGGCGHGINLKVEPTRTRVQAALDNLARLEAVFASGGNRS